MQWPQADIRLCARLRQGWGRPIRGGAEKDQSPAKMWSSSFKRQGTVLKPWIFHISENVPKTQETDKIFQGSLIYPDPQTQMMSFCIVPFGSGFWFSVSRLSWKYGRTEWYTVSLSEDGTSQVVQWLRIPLSMQVVWVWPLAGKLRSRIPWGKKPTCRNYWARVPGALVEQLLNPCTVTRESLLCNERSHMRQCRPHVPQLRRNTVK